ncbi:hypothetical protein FDF18_12505 [Clostridium sporogenes]|uniref:hypothetical protein n=1 Tax=Clostridium sporogenes TaxID=1509 RepID=UPI0013CB5BAF|nr:hypothetical protein [Clostridium sporogenes]NFT04104.1 hypothetical protein [Clostridium sporogenes]NFT31289.1 hypothetical protein [Clostridium sporogenes]NFT39528.1 hypothetical protein [Clostridium sporogenes]NFT54601.1 hypothetical protein [Clostridium sporogenes]NFT75758.1 hypothetical protein [Clostridium sporogenes]
MIIYVCLRENKEEKPILRVIEHSNVSGLVHHDILLTTGFGLHLANHTLRLLDTGIDVKFDNFTQFNDMIMDINDIVLSRYKDIDVQALFKCVNS